MNGDIGWTKYSNWLERLAKYLSQDVDMDLLVKSFTEFNNNEDRVRFCFSDNTRILRNRIGKFYEEEYPALPIEPDVIEAKKFCQQAASELNQRKFEEAAEYYTEALKCCVHWKSSSHVPNLGTMFANRSLCHFNLQAYKNSLDDIEFAFMFKCPDSVKETLQIRKLKCLVSLGNRLEAQNYLENSIKSESPLLVDQASSVLSKSVKLDDEPDSENALSEDFGAGFFECASSKMELKSESNKGRFVVANREVQIGEVLFQEKTSCCSSSLFPNNMCLLLLNFRRRISRL
ncbi:SET and MYND domain-containing protein 4 [Halotydeus destructor]|nr:SET and MYND domain-containing protein 4 [Halotydeus destructor]